MPKAKFKVIAICTNSGFGITRFVKFRTVVVKTSAGGYPYEISKLVCPGCRMWNDVGGPT